MWNTTGVNAIGLSNETSLRKDVSSRNTLNTPHTNDAPLRDGVRVGLMTDVDIGLHDRVVDELVNARRLSSDHRRLERTAGHRKPSLLGGAHLLVEVCIRTRETTT